mgnify:FL=1
MAVKILFAVALLAVGIFFVSRKHFIFKILGVAGLLLWLFLGDWGGLELAKKLFFFATRNTLLFFEILGGIVVAILVLGWLLSKVTGGKATAKRSFAERIAKPKSDEPTKRKTVYKVGGVEFNDYGAALQFAAQVFPNQNHPSSYITKEER